MAETEQAVQVKVASIQAENGSTLELFLVSDEHVIFHITDSVGRDASVTLGVDAFDDLENQMDEFEMSEEGSAWLSKYLSD